MYTKISEPYNPGTGKTTGEKARRRCKKSNGSRKMKSRFLLVWSQCAAALIKNFFPLFLFVIVLYGGMLENLYYRARKI